jgi:penicillin-insensitive murein endopeptidase
VTDQSPRTWALRACGAAAFAWLALGCLGTPTPLAPGLRGSVGVPHHGVLTDGAELPVQGPGYVRYRPQSPHYWGNPRLIRALQVAAATVAEARPDGAPLVIGDIAARHGGKIPHHRSHRTGRDADLLFYSTTPAGAAVESSGFLHFDSDGLARLNQQGDFVRFDVERNWLLVKALLCSPHAEVQWMFMSRKLEALLIDYARARGESPALLWHAETVLLQPGDSAAHDDHFHLRIACTPEESVAGCEGGGPRWEWLSALPAAPTLGPAELDAIAADDPLREWTSSRENAS